jgi:protease I
VSPSQTEAIPRKNLFHQHLLEKSTMSRQAQHEDKDAEETNGSSAVQNIDERALDNANEMSFPASDPIAISDIQRVTTTPDMAKAASEHQNSATIQAASNTDIASKSENLENADGEGRLDGLKIAALVTDGFEESELLEPKQALEKLGAQVEIVSSVKDGQNSLQGFKHMEKSVKVKIDKDINEAKADEYDGVLLPGGVINGDAMRSLTKAHSFVQQMDQAGKPIAAICHGGWLLISAELVRGRTLTSWPSMQVDFENAGGQWVDRESVKDGNLITARKPADIPAFNDAFIKALRA